MFYAAFELFSKNIYVKCHIRNSHNLGYFMEALVQNKTDWHADSRDMQLLITLYYSQISHQVDIEPTLAFLLSMSNFKPGTSFGSLSKTTIGMFLGLFVKSQIWFVWRVFVVSGNMCFPGFFRDSIDPLSSKLIFNESNYCTRIMCV